MGIEETIKFLIDFAVTQEARLAKLEQNRALLEHALRRLSEREQILELLASGVQAEPEENEEPAVYRPRKSRSILKPDHPAPPRDCRPARRPRHKPCP